MAALVVSRLTGDANRWMIACLDIGPHDRVLDVGCGPGLGVALAAEITASSDGLSGGLVVGVDAATTMVRHARRRNRAGIRAGRVEIAVADAAALPFPDGHFTRAWSLNSVQFWPAPELGLREMRRVLSPGGVAVLGVMARHDDPPAPDPPGWIGDLGGMMAAQDLSDIAVECQTFGGVVHWALRATRVEKRVAPRSTPRRTG